MAIQRRFGGSFAPPLTDALLAKYKAIIEGMDAKSPIRDAMQKLYDCVTKWWEEPVSTKGAKRAHQSGTGSILDLDKEIRDRLWDCIPWDTELDAMQELFDPIEKDICARNDKRIEAWQASMAETVVNDNYKTEEERVVMRHCLQLIRIAAGENRVYPAFIEVLSQNEQIELRVKIDKARRVKKFIADSLVSKSNDKLPYPTLEPTQVRDAAFHLLWHARELERDREPLTKDQL